MTEFPPFRLDSENQCLWRDTERITLTPKAFFLLKYLVERAGRLVTHTELLESLWPDSFVQPEVLKTQILDIRHALGDDAKAPRFIETQPRRGYRFIAAIENVAASEPASRPGPEASIAVLPFVNLGGAGQNEYFGDGLAEDVINELAKIPGLKVIARTSAFAFKGRTQDIRRIAEILGVANILEGSFRCEGDRLRIMAQLISASDGNHLWSGRFDRAVTDVLTIQDEIAQAIADALRTKLRGPGERRPSSSEAYRAYLEGRYFVQQVTPQAIDHALECYERAIQLDPGYALPHSGLALQAYYRVLYLAQRPNELAPAALAALGRALQLDPESAQSHVVRGVFSAFYEYNWNDADDHFVKALQMDPASPMVRVARALWFLVPTRRLPEALAEIKIGVTLDPLSPAVRISELWVLYTLRTPEAVDKARSLIQLFPSLPICRFVAGLTLLRHNLIDEAATTLEAGLSVTPGDVFLLGVMALVRSRQGRVADVDNIRDDLDRRASERHIPFLPRSFVAEASGNGALAHKLLDQAVNEREPIAVIAVADQYADEVCRPGSDSLLRKMNLL
ncbi:MAG: winged helix-turn-helix domain-containing protein [Acidobacteriia bacterium]|nr:winged helix-turn-helix domain-containing protein [Terriglobia bacterium]